MRPARLLIPLTVTVVVASGCAAGGTSPGAAQSARQTESVKPVQATLVAAQLPQAGAWSRRDASMSAAPKLVVGVVASNQRVRVVRLAKHNGRPVITVSTAVGPQAAASAVSQAQNAEGTVAVDVDSRVSILSDPAPSNDPYRSRQWAMTRLKAESIWPVSQGAGVTVAVIDTGVAPEPDLAAQLLPGYDWITGSAGGTADGQGHGTHVAGIIAAVAGNDVGVAGLAPEVKILPLRALDDMGSGYQSNIATAIIYAADHGANVINLSLGGSSTSSVMSDAVGYAQSRDVVVVAAAGNSKTDGNAVSYPAAYPNVLAVGATDANDAVGYFSNTGSYLKLAAPGVQIVSTYPGGYAVESGTSMASPYVAAAAALVRSAAPTLSATATAAALTSTATDRGAKGWDDLFGSGIVNPRAAVCSVTTCPTAQATRLTLNRPPTAIGYGRPIVLTAQLRYGASSDGVADRPVTWCSRTQAGRVTCLAGVTDSTGTSKMRFAPTVNTMFSVTYAGDQAALASASAEYTVGVTAKISLKVSRQKLDLQVAPGGVHGYRVQRWTGRAWVTQFSGNTQISGRAAVSRIPSGAIVRVVMAADVNSLNTVTRSVRIA
jgi:serine protease